jgi:glycosyltransferase involved in cell wall biosynthesis
VSVKRVSKLRSLLVITYHFPPDGTVGGQRWAGLSKYLARLGWEVHVVTASPMGRERDDPGVHRHFRHRRRTLNDVYRAAVGRAKRGADADQQVPPENRDPARQSLVSRTLSSVRRIAGVSIYLPDHARGWITRAASAARGLLREKRFDAVISSGPPHSAHLVGFLATRGTGVHFLVDMRDPWSTAVEMHLPVDRVIRAQRFLLRRLERLIFPRATQVIVNTREFASSLRAYEPEADIIWFPNGIDLEQLPEREVSGVEQGSFAHIGAIYGNRNLSSVFAAMQAVLRDRPQAALRLKLNVAGGLESPHREQMHDAIASAGLTSNVRVHGVLPRAKALELLSRSHIALVLAQDQPMCVPAKIYESMGLGVPTLVIAEEASAAAREARRIGAMTLEEGDVDGLRRIMEDMLDGRVPTRIEARTPISYEELAVQMDRLLTEGRWSGDVGAKPFSPSVDAPT